MKPFISFLAVCLCFALSAEGAQRAFVSAGTGSDANNCSRALPCRNFSAAFTQTDAGGEIIVLDSGGYGTVSITAPVSIIAPTGVHAAITGFSVPAITVAVGAFQTVILRGLALDSQGANTGIDFQSGQRLFVESCTLNQFATRGISVDRSADNVVMLLSVKDTIIRNGVPFFDTFSSPIGGIYLSSSGANSSVSALIERTRIETYYAGVYALSNARVVVNDSQASFGSYGFLASASTGNASLTVENSVAAFNEVGMYAGDSNYSGGGTSVIRVSNSVVAQNSFAGVNTLTGGTAYVAFSTITRNPTGVLGTVHSLGNNRLFDNTAAGTFTSTIPQQ